MLKIFICKMVKQKIQRVEIGTSWWPCVLTFERKTVFLNLVSCVFGAVYWCQMLLEAWKFVLRVLIHPWKHFTFQNIANVLLGVNVNTHRGRLLSSCHEHIEFQVTAFCNRAKIHYKVDRSGGLMSFRYQASYQWTPS